ncbi:MAG: hypothetical protein QNJ53_29085 [Pleurocapsa sp. MO_192.B19]|nr:hypothetical protein [Pleurocapsa sp. MO_192.B19]
MIILARAGNYKAFRRTYDPACGFTANLVLKGNDHKRHNLLAFSRSQLTRE